MNEIAVIKDVREASDLELYAAQCYAKEMLKTFETLECQVRKMPLVLQSLLEERGNKLNVNKLTTSYLKLLLIDMTTLMNRSMN